jgi:hypothetical protein
MALGDERRRRRKRDSARGRCGFGAEREERIKEDRVDVGRGEGRVGEGQERRDKASPNREERIRELRRERNVEGAREEGEERRWERRGSGTGRFQGRNEMEGSGTV